MNCASRIRNRVQITTDGYKAYFEAVENAFGADVDYAQLQKIYGAPSENEQRRYSPARCLGTDMKVVSGDSDPNISTSFVERQNLSMRMGMRRLTRLRNGFSKKAENHRVWKVEEVCALLRPKKPASPTLRDREIIHRH